MSFYQKISAFTALCLMSAPLAFAQDSQPASMPAAISEAMEVVDTKTAIARQMSEVIGFQIADQMSTLGLDFDQASFMKGLSAGLAGEDFPYSPEEMVAFQTQMQEIAMAAEAEAGQRNQSIADAYLAENKGKDGVVTTESGLQYTILEEGEGDSPAKTDEVTVHYAGTLIDGTEFDSSYSRGEPATFPLTGVIAGWTEGLQYMKPGAKFRFFIPPDLAYGANGSAPKIEPNSMLIFDVELISIN